MYRLCTVVNCEAFLKALRAITNMTFYTFAGLRIEDRTFWKWWSDIRIEKLSLFEASQRGILCIYFNFSRFQVRVLMNVSFL